MPGSYLLFIFLASIAGLLISIIRFKINPFLALLGVGLLTGLLCGMPPGVVAKQLSAGFGQTLGGIGIVIGLGVVFGTLLANAGATGQIAGLLLRNVGNRRAPLAVNLTGYFAAIPVFFDAAFVVFMPLLRQLSRDTGLPVVRYVTALSIGLIATHCLVIPTPGPLAVMGSLGIDAGAFIGAAMGVALVAALTGGLLMGRYLSRNAPTESADTPSDSPENVANKAADTSVVLPSGRRSLAVLLFPIGLILMGSILTPLLPAGSVGRQVFELAGDKNVAMLLGVVLAGWSLRPYLNKSFDALVVDGAAQAGLILLITGAGGAFGSVIATSGIGDYLVQSLSALHLSPLLLGFVLAALLRAAQGSATVALVTTSAILAPLLTGASAIGSSVHPLTVGLAICCGGICCSFPNDSAFWVVSRFGGLTVGQTLRAWTLASTVAGVAGLLVTLLIDYWL